MRQEPESQLGVVAGLIAVIMVMALSAMAFTALQPQSAPHAVAPPAEAATPEQARR